MNPRNPVKTHSLKQRLSYFNHLRKAKTSHKCRELVEWLACRIPRASTVLDIGAHHGYWSKELATLHDHSLSIHAFEPSLYNFSILESVTHTSGNVTVHRIALADASGIRTLYIPVKKRGNLGMGLAHLGNDPSREHVRENVEALTVDDFIANAGLQSVVFVKCDVEGAEIHVLSGSKTCLENMRPDLYLETHPPYMARLGSTPDALWSLLKPMGYASYRVDETQLRLRRTDGYEGGVHYLFSVHPTDNLQR